MSRPWRAGQARKHWVWLGLSAFILAGVATPFVLRALEINRVAKELWALRAEQNRLCTEIEELKAELEKADDPKTVEMKAREILRWAYPDEELVIIRRR